MRIQKITNLPKYNYNFEKQDKNETAKEQSVSNPFNITFEARVDKGLLRFYEFNAERMPKTLKKYIEQLPDKTSQSPLFAQRMAFIALGSAVNVAAVQAAFPEDENLFAELKDPEETKASRGILGVYRENKELLELCEQGILNNGENLTVWLLKKIFLESKTLQEINEDLEQEINPEFKEMYDAKESGQMIHSSTLKALGIKQPEFEYLQSLRYTRPGYSDMVGDKISVANRNFWESMPIEERTARNKKRVENFENWWNSMTRNEKLELIAEQISELELLEKYNNSEFGKKHRTRKSTPNTTERKSTETSAKEKHTSSLSQDELFGIWAGNNLKIFYESLTEYDKRKITLIREQKRAEKVNSMTPQERTEFINKLKTSSEPSRYAMIYAWNKNPDILASLSLAMKKGYIEKPLDAIYGTEEFNEHLSSVMSDFWDNNPEYAERWGNSLHEAYEVINTAIANGRFESLKKDILKARALREKEVADKIKNYKEIFSKEEYEALPEYMKQFYESYIKQMTIDLEFFPTEYFRDFFHVAQYDLTQEQIISWTKALNSKPMDVDDYVNMNKINDTETPAIAVMNRALEATLADILYECTGDAKVYLLSHSDCKMALRQIKNNYEYIAIGSLKLNKEFTFPIRNRDIDADKIAELYKYYRQPVTEKETEWIIEQYFDTNNPEFLKLNNSDMIYDILKSYIMLYGKSNEIIFTTNDDYTPLAKQYFAIKFLNNLPPQFPIDKISLLTVTEADFKRERQIMDIDTKFRNKYSFIPKALFETFIIEVNRMLRSNKNFDLSLFEQRYCKQIKSTNDNCNAFFIPRNNITAFNSSAFLSIEQALADAIYKSTKEPKVYALSLEELLLTIESINTIKRFKGDKINMYSVFLKDFITLSPKTKINVYNIEKACYEYNDEIIEYLQTCYEEHTNSEQEEILYILNPDENASDIDKYTNLRLKYSIFAQK